MRLRIPQIGVRARFLLPITGMVVVGSLWCSVPFFPSVTLATPSAVSEIAISGDGKTLATLGGSHLTVWDIASPQQRSVLQLEPTGPPDGRFFFGHRIRLTPSGQAIAYRAESGRIQWWRAGSSDKPVTLLEQGELFDLTADGRTLITEEITSDVRVKPLHLWNMETGTQRPLPPGLRTMVAYLKQLNDGRIVGIDEVSRFSPWGLRIWDLTNGKLLQLIPQGRTPAAVSPDGTLLAAHDSERGGCSLWDLKSGRPISMLWQGFSPAEFSPDGRRLAAIESRPRPERSQIWNVGTLPPRLLSETAHGSARFSADGRWILLRPEFEPSVTLCDAESLRTMCELQDISNIQPVLSPDGATMVFSRRAESHLHWVLQWLLNEESSRYRLELWDIVNDRQLACLVNARTGPTVRVASVAYFPNGKSIAIAKDDGSIEIWAIPPRRPFLIEYGLPLLFALLLLLGGWQIRWWRRRGAGG